MKPSVGKTRTSELTTLGWEGDLVSSGDGENYGTGSYGSPT